MARKKGKNKKRATVKGTLQKHKRGFGFVSPGDGGEDIFISRRGMNGGMNGDLVEVNLIPEYLWKNSREGIIVSVVERASTEVVGTFHRSKKFGFVVPSDKAQKDDVFVGKKHFGGAKMGDRVVVQITKYPTANDSAQGRISQIISREGEPGGDIKALIRHCNLDEQFPPKVEAEAAAEAASGISLEDIRGRVDLRDKMIMTIDGADSKDFDDGVSCEKLPGGNYLLGVHIADVTHYVQNNGPLDREAMKRGNSIYLLNRVIPMLPVSLSNGICSLNPGEDRLTLTCQMEVNGRGEVVDHKIFKSIIRSKERMVYTDVSDIIEDKSRELKEKYGYILEEIMMMDRLATILRKKRQERGSLDFDLDEASITLNEVGIPTTIGIAERRVANQLIEEFMLLANEVVAREFFFKEAPFVYRIHEKPDNIKLEEFVIFLKNFGIGLPDSGASVHPKDLKGVLEKVKGETYENVVNTVMLRSMQKAVYSTDCKGHFGLALQYYCHFTSPIRRYPDLMIHRIIKAYLAGPLSLPEKKAFLRKAEEVAKVASATERQAIDLERQVEKMKKAEYMASHVGEEFPGVISGVTNFGIYVEISNTIEGMARLDELDDDYYDVQREKYRAIGRRTKNIHALGDKVRVKVKSVNLEDSEINFTLL